MAQLCPGKEKMIKDSQDLDPAVFRRLVVRRYRQQIDPAQPLVDDENARKELEKHFLEKINLTSDFLPAHFLKRTAHSKPRLFAEFWSLTGLGTSAGTGFLIAPHVTSDQQSCDRFF